MVRTNRLLRASDGMAGGAPGALSTNILNPGDDNLELPRKAHMHMDVKSGDRIYHVISGSGGHGDPWVREPEKVLVDVKDEKLTVAAAREQYGVVIDPQSLSVDWEKTATLRQKRTEPAVAAAD
jgi:N-methylhydantoinase B